MNDYQLEANTTSKTVLFIIILHHSKSFLRFMLPDIKYLELFIQNNNI